MEELLSDHSKFVKIEFNSKHIVNQDVRHLLDMEFGRPFEQKLFIQR